MAFPSPSNVEEVRETLRRIQKNLECPICLELLSDPYSTQCSHPFCRTCISMVISSNKEARCPLCKESISKRSMNENSRLADIVEAVKVLERAIIKDSGIPSTPPRPIPDNHSHEATGTPGIVMHSLLHPTPHKPPLAEGISGVKSGALKCDSVGENKPSVSKSSASGISRIRHGKRVRFAQPTKRQSRKVPPTDQAALLLALQEAEFVEWYSSAEVEDGGGYMVTEESERNDGQDHVERGRSSRQDRGGKGHVVTEERRRNDGQDHRVTEERRRNDGQDHKVTEERKRNDGQDHKATEERERNSGQDRGEDSHVITEERGRDSGQDHGSNGREGHMVLDQTVSNDEGDPNVMSNIMHSPPRKKRRTNDETINNQSSSKVLDTPVTIVATGIPGNMPSDVAPGVQSNLATGAQGSLSQDLSALPSTGCQEKKPHTPSGLNSQCIITAEEPWLVPGNAKPACVPRLPPTPAIDSNRRTILETPFIEPEMAGVVRKTPFVGTEMVRVVGETPFVGPDVVGVVGETPFVGPDMAGVVGETPFVGPDVAGVVRKTPFVGTEMVRVVGETPFVGPEMAGVVRNTPFVGPDVAGVVRETPFVGPDVAGAVRETPFVGPAVVRGTPFVGPDVAGVVGETPFVGPDVAGVVRKTPFVGPEFVEVVWKTPLAGVPPEAMEEVEILAKETQYLDISSLSVDSHREPFPTIEETQIPSGHSELLMCNETMNAHSSSSNSTTGDGHSQNVEPDHTVPNQHVIPPTCPGQAQCIAETPEGTGQNEHTEQGHASLPLVSSPAVTKEAAHTKTSTTKEYLNATKTSSPTTPNCSKEDLNSTTPDLADLLKESPTTTPDQIPVAPPSVASPLTSPSLLNHSISPSIPLQNACNHGYSIAERSVIPDTLGSGRCCPPDDHCSIPSSQHSPVHSSTDTMLPGLYPLGVYKEHQQSTDCHVTIPVNETTPVVSTSGTLDPCLNVIPDSLQSPPLPSSLVMGSQAKGQPFITSMSPEEGNLTQWDIKSSMFSQELTSQEVESLKRQMEEKQREIQELEEALFQAKQEPETKSCCPPRMEVSPSRSHPPTPEQNENCHKNTIETPQLDSNCPGAEISQLNSCHPGVETSQLNSDHPGAETSQLDSGHPGVETSQLDSKCPGAETSPEVSVVADSYPTAYSTHDNTTTIGGPTAIGCEVVPVKPQDRVTHKSQRKKSQRYSQSSQQRGNVQQTERYNHSSLTPSCHEVSRSTTKRERKRPTKPETNTLKETFKKSSPSDKTSHLLEKADKLIKALRSPPSVALDSQATMEVDRALLKTTPSPRTQHKTSSKKQTHKAAPSSGSTSKKKVPLVVLGSQDVENYSPPPLNVPLPGDHPFLTISTHQHTPIPNKEVGLFLKHHTPYKEKTTPSSIVPVVKSTVLETPHIPLSGSHAANETSQNGHVPSFVGSGLSKHQLKQSQLLAKKFGGRIASCFNGSTTHVIVVADENGQCTRTVKYLQGIAAGKWILDYKWIEDSLQAGNLLPESVYEVKGDHVCGNNAPQRAHEARTTGQLGLFYQYNLLLTGHFSTVSHEHLSQLIQLAHGTLISDTLKFLPRVGSRNVVVCDEADALKTLSFSRDQYSVVASSWVIDSLSEYLLLPLAKYQLNEQ